MGMKNKPSAKNLSVNANKGELLKLIVFGSDEEFELLGDNPSTGSQTVIPVIMLAFTLLIACILLVKFKNRVFRIKQKRRYFVYIYVKANTQE